MGGGIGGLILMAAIVLLSGGDLGDIVGGLILIALLLFMGGDLGDLVGGGGGTGGGAVTAQGDTDLDEECRTGEDANRRQDCRIVGYVNSVQAYWQQAFEAAGQSYTTADTVLFTDAVNTACGGASSAVGPFYCPLDQTIYIDLGFFEVMEQRLGAQGGELAEAYVIAHEYGHHVQNLLGLLDAGRDAGAEGGAVRTELQADCFAGVWAGNAVETGYIEPLTREQINQALDTAAAIGDDRIQEQTQGQVNPETWTHGSSEQRQEWFTRGLERADPNACDTFDADI